MLVDHGNQQIFNPQERRMIERVLNLNQRTVSSIMTSRHDIEHIDLNAPEDDPPVAGAKSAYAAGGYRR